MTFFKTHITHLYVYSYICFHNYLLYRHTVFVISLSLQKIGLLGASVSNHFYCLPPLYILRKKQYSRAPPCWSFSCTVLSVADLYLKNHTRFGLYCLLFAFALPHVDSLILCNIISFSTLCLQAKAHQPSQLATCSQYTYFIPSSTAVWMESFLSTMCN